jgi:hypothetical protein
MKIEKVIDGIVKYIDRNILPEMNSLQEAGYLILVESVKADTNLLKQYFANNVFARMLLSVDKDGEVNVERLVSGLKKVIAKKGDLKFSIPMYGNFTLTSEDITEILRNMTEEHHNEVNT